MTRRTLLALVAAGLAAAVPAVASAVMLWTLVGTPLTTTVSQSTTFTLTATNLDALTELGCLEVDLPGSFVIEALGTPSASNGDTWTSGQSGNAVIVHSLSGGGRLELGETVQFTIRAHATVAGAFLWPNHAHRQQDCSTADQAGVSLSVTVLPALLPTPSPTPKPAPTVTPAPTPTPSPILPLPSIDLPLPLPTLTPTPTAGATASPAPPRATATLVPTASPAPTASPTPAGGSGAIVSDPRDDDGTGGAPTTVTFQVDRGADGAPAGADAGIELSGLLEVDFVWFVPAASVAVPGLLVIVWVLLQAIGALAWIPAVRRMSQEDAGRRRPEAG